MQKPPCSPARGDVPREEDVVAETLNFAERLLPHVVDGVAYINEALERGDDILAEGAQGTLLDITYGSYPYVTSSSTIAGGACSGLGDRSAVAVRYGHRNRQKRTARASAAGPFPSELAEAEAEQFARGGP